MYRNGGEGAGAFLVVHSICRHPTTSRGSGRRLGRLLVVVHVGFLTVLPGLILVRVVGVGERRVVLLMVVLGCQVRHCSPWTM